MTVYSHSRLSCFEQCPHKFKLQYIDKVETEVEESIEAFLGLRVHETLEKLYRDLLHHKKISLDDLLLFLNKEWKSNWDDSIIIVKKEYGSTNYLSMAEKFITDYYNRYKPFDQTKTIGLEQRIIVNLDDYGDYKLQGLIDMLSETKNGFYEIHDYKTNSRLPLNDYIRSDRQLALYMIGVKNSYPDVKDVRLILHFLAFDKEVDSTRSDEELESLKKETIKLIDRIESEERFEANPSVVCDWCEFRSVCCQWSHLYKIMDKPENEYLKDSGVKLVNRYAELKERQKQVKTELEDEIVKLEEALIEFAEKEHVDCVFGSKNKVRITTSMRYLFPSKNSKERERLEQLLNKYGKWQDVVQLDMPALAKIILERQWEKPLLDALAEYLELEQSKRLYLSKLKE